MSLWLKSCEKKNCENFYLNSLIWSQFWPDWCLISHVRATLFFFYMIFYYELITVREMVPKPVFNLWQRTVSATKGTRYIRNLFSHWLRPCSAIDRKGAQVIHIKKTLMKSIHPQEGNVFACCQQQHSLKIQYSVFITVCFLKHTHNGQPIPHTHGWGMGCVFVISNECSALFIAVYA